MPIGLESEPVFSDVDPYEPIESGPDDLDRAARIQWARDLEGSIRSDPTRAQRVMKTLGDVATTRNGNSLLGFDLDDEDLGLAILIVGYFGGNCDSGVVYDDATEFALRRDKPYQAALAEHRKATSILSTKSAMSHELVPNDDANPASERVRRLSLSIFIDRSVEWQARQHTET